MNVSSEFYEAKIFLKNLHIRKLCTRCSHTYEDFESAYVVFENHGCDIEFDDDKNIISCSYTGEGDAEVVDLMSQMIGLVESESYFEIEYDYEGAEVLLENEVYVIRWFFGLNKCTELSYAVTIDENENEISRRLIESRELNPEYLNN